MELELSRIDYAIVGLTSSNCLKLLPSSHPKEPQKVVVADNDGILQIFSIKKEDIQLHFKTLPGPKISALRLGGSATDVAPDKIFISVETEVKAYTKKGKLFLTFDSNMTEPITSMYVLGNDLFLCGKHIYNHYRDCKDIGSYLCGDKIIDVIAFYTEKTKRLMSLIACEGRMIRALEHSRVTMSMEVASAPTVLHIYQSESGKLILFGTIDGRVGVLNIEKKQGFDWWIVDNEKSSGSISCMDSYDFSGNDRKNLILGREDGNIEVYNINIDDKLDKSVLIYSIDCNESVTSLQCGVVGSPGFYEILVATYTGRVFGLTTETVDKTVRGDSTIGKYIFSPDTSQKISKLKSEIEDLQIKVIREREKYQSSTQSYFDELSAIPLIEIKDSFVLSKDTATYTLTIEVPMAIDNILLQSNIPIDLLDAEKNSAVVSYSDSDILNGNHILATYRCQINTNRLELKIRTIEGQYGILRIYVTPLVQPKCSRIKQFDIKPLSLHFRIHNFDEARPLNKLVIKGAFSLAEIHNWLGQCLPEIPEKVQHSEKTVLSFQSAFLNTILRCSYQKGETCLESDNISTISILKEFLTKEATKKKIKIDINTAINDDSIDHTISLLEPELLRHQNLSNKIALLNALDEFDVSDEEILNYLSTKYKNLLLEKKEIRNEYQHQPNYLNRFYEIIEDLYMDYNKFKGINNVKSKLTKLHEILENYSFENLVEFFRPEISK